MPGDGDDHDGAPAGEPGRLDLGWRRASRVATASAGMGAALAGALHVFAGVSAGLLVLGSAAAALAIGSRLPAASPRRSIERLREHLAV